MKGASQIAPLGVRLPDELKLKVQGRASENGRSMNAEIVSIIESSFSNDSESRNDAAEKILNQLQQIVDLKDKIIASQESSINSQEKIISALEQRILLLEGQISRTEAKKNHT